MEKYYITTAIDYVNAKPHIGHAYEKIAADVFSKVLPLTRQECIFCHGLDEHGSKIEKLLNKPGLSRKSFAIKWLKSLNQPGKV